MQQDIDKHDMQLH